MQTLPPIQLPGQPRARGTLTTHAITAVTAAGLAVGGTVGVQQAVPAPKPAAMYETRLRDAWAQEQATHGPKDAAAHRRRLIFMYRATIMAIEMGELKTLAELSKAAKDQEAAMGMVGRLPILRAIIATEWHAQIGDGGGAISPATRVDISAFMRQTVSLLDGLP